VSVPRISKEELKQRLESGQAPLLLDVRLKYPYEHSTVKLPGAVRLVPIPPIDAASIPRDRDLIAYDSDPGELTSSAVAAELIRRGYRVHALAGGIADWIAANYPVETKGAPRQAAPEPGSLKG
jgi:rhodanese-related sulfurtransferase